jgi:hypothetical protein
VSFVSDSLDDTGDTVTIVDLLGQARHFFSQLRVDVFFLERNHALKLTQVAL